MRGSAKTPDVPSATPSRIKALPACLGFLALGALALALMLPGLLSFLHGVTHRAPLVVLKPYEAIGLPLAVAFVGIAGLTLSDPALPGRRRPHTKRRPATGRVTWPGACLFVVFLGLAGTALAVPVVEVAATIVMPQKGYRSCPDTPEWHHPPMRWALPEGHCP